jgi:hypothetical protein
MNNGRHAYAGVLSGVGGHTGDLRYRKREVTAKISAALAMASA